MDRVWGWSHRALQTQDPEPPGAVTDQGSDWAGGPEILEEKGRRERRGGAAQGYKEGRGLCPQFSQGRSQAKHEAAAKEASDTVSQGLAQIHPH